MDDDVENGWRGVARFQLKQHERQLQRLESGLALARDEIAGLRLAQATMTSEVKELRGDIAIATVQLERGRQADADRMLETIRSGQRRGRDIVVSLVYPLAGFVIGALILAALTGQLGH